MNNTRYLFFTALAFLLIFSSCYKPVSKQYKTGKNFNENWNFKISELPINETGVDSINWEKISLPHTPKIEPKVMKGQWQGTCWYYKTFELGDETKDHRFVMRFEGAMNTSEYWVNGHKVASHLGGYLPVVFDFTDVANVGGANEILIRLNNTDNPVTGPKPMLQLDFNMFGGLYRDAFLFIKNPLHISDPILAGKTASGGVFVTYPKVSKESATVHVKTNVMNQFASLKRFKIQQEIWDEGKLVSRYISKEKEIDPQTNLDVLSETTVNEPKLWSPKSPYLYTLKTQVIVEGNVVDENSTRIGIRRFNVSKEGFYINGEKMFLRGVNRHQEYPYMGYAISNNAQYRDALKIKEAGFDYVRLSHYPHSPAFMDACDELGLVVVDAILGWQYFSEDTAFQKHVFQTARDLIRRDRNHASVLAWEVSLNESWMPKPFIDSLHVIAHQEYPGDQCFSAGWMSYGYDIYLQARQHRLKHYDSELEKPYAVSEYGDWEYYAMNAGLNQDDWNDLLQDERSSRQLISDGEVRLLQQAANIQEAHNDNFNTPAFSDGYWVMFDYNRGYSDDLEASGIMSIDRIPKFSYFFYKSQRDADETSGLYDNGPMVHIASWWTENSPLNVKVYSNCDEVELFLNGKSLGKQHPDSNLISTNLAHPPFTFKLNKFEEGELLAKAYINDTLASSHVVRTPGEFKSLELVVDDKGKSIQAGCNDVVFVYAKLIDENGTVVRENNVNINFYLEGDGSIVSPNALVTEAGVSTALIKIGASKRPMKVIAKIGDVKSEKMINPL